MTDSDKPQQEAIDHEIKASLMGVPLKSLPEVMMEVLKTSYNGIEEIENRIAVLLKYAKVDEDEQELYNELIRRASEVGYDEEAECFFNGFIEIIDMLIQDYQKIPFFRLKPLQEMSDEHDSIFLNVNWSIREKNIYFRDLCIDRPNPGLLNEDPSIYTIIDKLKLREDVFKKVEKVHMDTETNCSLSGELDDVWGSNIDSDDSESEYESTTSECRSNDDENEESVDKVQPFLLLTDLLLQSSLSAKQEIFRRLAEQRYSVPIFVTDPNSQTLVYLVNSLLFTKVKLLKGWVMLSDDVSMPRIVFLSRRNDSLSESRQLVKSILHCNLGSIDLKSGLSTTGELTVGFVNPETPCLVFHVRNDYIPLIPFLKQFTPDAIITELNPTDITADTSWKINLKEITKNVVSYKVISQKLKVDQKMMSVDGSFHDVSEFFTKKFLPVLVKAEVQERQMLKDFSIDASDNIVGLEYINRIVENQDFCELRKKMNLQSSFQTESKHRCDMQFSRIPDDMHAFEKQAANERDARKKNAVGHVRNQPVLSLYVDILRIQDEDLRFVALSLFEKIVDEQCGKVLKTEKENVRTAWDEYNRHRQESDDVQLQQDAEKAYYDAKTVYAQKSVGVENIWREFCHAYVALPDEHKELPYLAAQHLVDGFALEILDGDAGCMCFKWTKDVFRCLDDQLKERLGREPKVFVLSIMGIQSTGKSTLLNTMFGCRLKVSAGQCTKGVNMQLVRTDVEGAKYDYILVIDTEGLRSPEFFGKEGSVWRDNRMATFSILSSNATIITTVNEDDSAIKEVIPIVMLAHKRSEIAEQNSGRLPSMMFFVYSKVDTTAVEKFGSNRRELQTELVRAVDDMKNIGVQTEINFLSYFQMSDNEDESDVKYLGLLNKGETPPDDTPNFDYGRKVAGIREYIFKRTKDRDCDTLKSWGEYLQLVYTCLDTTDFELSFKTAMEHHAYIECKADMDTIKHAVAEEYRKEYSKLEDNVISKPEKEIESLEAIKLSLKNAVKIMIEAYSKNAKNILAKRSYESFRERQTRSWDNCIEKLHKLYDDKITTIYEGRFKYGKVKIKYQQEMVEILKERIKEDSTIKKDACKSTDIFEEVFKIQLIKVRTDYPCVDVKMEVDKEYAEHLNIHISTAKCHTNSLLRQMFLNPLKYAKEMFHRVKCGESIDDVNLKELQNKIENILNSAKNYDLAVVRKVIMKTSEHTEHFANRRYSSEVHATIKDLTIDVLTIKQQKWEENYNIASMLIKEKDVLKAHFEENICKEIFGKQRAINQICAGIMYAVKLGFVEYLSVCVKGKIENKGWVKDSDIAEAHVDFKLLNLSKSGNVAPLIYKLLDPAKTYDDIVRDYIAAVLVEKEQNAWNELKNKIFIAIENAAAAAASQEKDGYNMLKSQILEGLNCTKLNKHIPDATTWDQTLNEDFDKENKKRIFLDIKDGILANFKTSLNKPTVELNECFDNVMTLLKENQMESSQPRCTVPCPKCQLTCRKSNGHEERHDCKHQPLGLRGGHWDKSKNLVSHSCAEMVANSCSFFRDDEWHPYTEFHNHFTTWQLPNFVEGTQSKVRKYLFQQHNQEIAGIFRRGPCDFFASKVDETCEQLLEEVKKKMQDDN